jgi:hypothetical protein
VIAALEKLIVYSQDEETRWQATCSLGQIDRRNPIAIDALVKLIVYSQDEETRMRAAYRLEQIAPGNESAIVVTNLRNDYGYERLCWSCAQNMPYAAFYQAWHHRSYMKLAILFARYRWWQITLCLFLGLSIFTFVRFTVSHSVNNPANIERQQQMR